ncbi:MAG: GNAT family N-acetyltransferase [Anaerolineae bacterium]|nr:GNAT family N-acetyltransferase [Anaerolineae bacterium]
MFDILEISPSDLARYAAIPMTLDVRTIFDIRLADNGLGGVGLVETPVSPYTKDYDEFGGPLSWPDEFDVSRWGFFLALHNGGQALGGAAVAWNTNGVNMLEGRSDLSVLWDIRVHPEWRKQGLGRALFAQSVQWSHQRGCTRMKIETQNINVPACRFYAAQGCQLGDIRRFAYQDEPAVAHEAQLNWYLNLLDKHLI